MFCEYHEALTLLARELIFTIEEIADSWDIFASDTTTYLVQLRETEFFRIRDEDGIGTEEVYTIFYDSRSDEYIVLMLLKCEDSLFDIVRIHLAMSGDNAWGC